jgi:hypothetical protein
MWNVVSRIARESCACFFRNCREVEIAGAQDAANAESHRGSRLREQLSGKISIGNKDRARAHSLTMCEAFCFAAKILKASGVPSTADNSRR